MKPIKLKIKGLNSFIEEQTIDFEKLGSRGLFGIFGPTGSGKSTVLDGITLALYGNVARKSSNFINTNCEKMSVYFEFQVSLSEVKKYAVDREFKRTNNSIRAGKCKIVDITNVEEKEVLADGVKSLNKKVEEIIGLNLEDFTRTVVLPQGKFSEFLKLEGKERREMLERLFNLQKYGDELSQKLYSKIAQEKSESSVLSGQLKGFEDISEEVLNNKVSSRIEIEKQLNKLDKELKSAINKYNESQELLNYQLELSKYKEEQIKLIKQEQSIDEKAKKIKTGESANKVLPYINAYEDTLKKSEENKKELSNWKIQLESIIREKEEITKNWIETKKEKDDKLPKLIVDEEKAKKALEESKYLKNIENNIDYIKKSISQLKEKLDKGNESLNKLNSINSEKTLSLKNFEEEYESLKIDEEFKQKVQEGLIFEENKARINNVLTKQNDKKLIIDKEIENITREGIKLKESLQTIDDSLKAKEEILESLVKNCPGEQKDIIKLNQIILQNEQKWEVYNKLQSEIKEIEEKLIIIKSENKNNKNLLNNKKSELDKIREFHKEKVKEELAHRLREELKEGDICPVCGSTHHIKKNINDVFIGNISELEEKIKRLEEEVNNINISIAKEMADISNFENRIIENKDEIKKLGNEFKEKTVDELKNEALRFEKAITEYNDKKESLEKEINNLKINQKEQDGEIKALRAKLRSGQNQLKSIENEINESKTEYAEVESKLNDLIQETKVKEFKEENEKIKSIEIKRDKISKYIKELRESIKLLEENKEKTVQELTKINEEIIKSNSDLQSFENNRKEKIESIRSNVGEESDIEGLLSKIQDSIIKINNLFEKLDKNKNEAEDKFVKCKEKVISLDYNNASLEERLKVDKEKAYKECEAEGFLEFEDVKENIIDKFTIESYKKEVEVYKATVSKINGLIESLLNKIDNRSISEEEFNSIKNLKEDKEYNVNQVKEEKIKIMEEIRNIKEKLDKQKELLESQKKLEHKLSLLSDLEKLFKGKKFVEFVASYQLKYVSIEASKRLKEITHGNYGLEVDEDGKFIIRDYKNGGVARDASTLSGGETFLASLSLALALSAQIQLKGTAPLELFFLDEGFGTLDDELLEVVMSSLEQIHNDKLRIGIISHVESIKNRVPVKLMVSPAESGMGGSKVKIEVS
ncbi:AAA family ATPase [Clostridium sp. SM-530-WT-3G]|nr:AAA family ATPase [Clostridium sp. SM-530-WT-3G]